MLTELYLYLARKGAEREDGTIDEITEDMIGTFEEAREEALGRGSLHYLRFGGREIMGQFARLLGTPERILPRGLLTWTLMGGFLGVLISASVWLCSPVEFRSDGMMRIRGPEIPDELLEASGGIQLFDDLETMKVLLLARPKLTQLINSHDLYPALLRRAPMSDAVEEFRDRTEIELEGDRTVRVAFTYSSGKESGLDDLFDEATGARTAQEITVDLMSRMISEHVEQRGRMTYQMTEFLAARLESVADQWAKLNARLQQLYPANPEYARVELDRNLAREHYIDIQQRLYAAEERNELTERAQGERLEIVDPASLPSRPENPLGDAVTRGGVAGLIVGLAIWLLLLARQLTRSARPHLSASEVS